MVCLLLLSLLQQDVGELIKQLGDDDPSKRDAATARLISLGPVKLASIRKYTDHADLEVRRRVRWIVGEIQRLDRVKSFRPSPRLTLEIHDMPITKAMESVFQPFGIHSKLREFPRSIEDRKVSLTLQEATLWEALDVFCSSANVQLGPSPHELTRRGGFSWTFLGGRSGGWRWVFDHGDVRILVTETVDGTGGVRHGEIMLDLYILLPPGSRVLSAELKDPVIFDGDKTKRVAVVKDPFSTQRRSRRFAMPPGRAVVGKLRATRIARKELEGIKKLRITGKVSLTFPRDVRRFTFSIRDMKEPVTKQVNESKVTLKSAKYTKDGWVLKWDYPQNRGLGSKRTYHRWVEDASGNWLFEDTGAAYVGSGAIPDTKWAEAGATYVIAEIIGQETEEFPMKIEGIKIAAVPDR